MNFLARAATLLSLCLCTGLSFAQKPSGPVIESPLALSAANSDYTEISGWLDRMAAAVQRLNYVGTFIYGHGSQLDAMRVVHAMTAEGEYEKLVSLTGDGREIHRDGKGVICYLPAEKSVLVDNAAAKSPFKVALRWDVERLSEVYRFENAGTSLVAGRVCRQINVRPKDHYRFGYSLCVDQGSGMLLKANLVNEKGVAIEKMMFTDIDYPVWISPDELKPNLDPEGYTWYRHNDEEDTAPTANGNWAIKSLPAGFRASVSVPKKLGPGRSPVYQTVYTDGLASVSVFVERLKTKQKPISGISSMGAITASSRVLDGHQITVIGDVPKATVQQIADSVIHAETTDETDG